MLGDHFRNSGLRSSVLKGKKRKLIQIAPSVSIEGYGIMMMLELDDEPSVYASLK